MPRRTDTSDPSEHDQCPEDLMEAVRSTHKIVRHLERAVTGDPYDPVHSPGLLRDVAGLRQEFSEHIATCGKGARGDKGDRGDAGGRGETGAAGVFKAAKKSSWSKAWLAGGVGGAVALCSTLGHFIGKGVTALLAIIFGGGMPPAPTAGAH